MAATKPQIQPVTVNVNKQQSSDLPKKHTGLTIAMVVALLTIVSTGVAFLSTYVFVTKAELADHKTAANGNVHSLDTEQQLTGVAVKALAKDVASVKIEQRELRIGQRVTNENLRRLLRRRGIQPAKREDFRIEERVEEK